LLNLENDDRQQSGYPTVQCFNTYTNGQSLRWSM